MRPIDSRHVDLTHECHETRHLTHVQSMQPYIKNSAHLQHLQPYIQNSAHLQTAAGVRRYERERGEGGRGREGGREGVREVLG